MLDKNLQLQVMCVLVLCNAGTRGFITTAHYLDYSDTWEHIANEAIVHIYTPLLPSQMYI